MIYVFKGDNLVLKEKKISEVSKDHSRYKMSDLKLLEDYFFEISSIDLFQTNKIYEIEIPNILSTVNEKDKKRVERFISSILTYRDVLGTIIVFNISKVDKRLKYVKEFLNKVEVEDFSNDKRIDFITFVELTKVSISPRDFSYIQGLVKNDVQLISEVKKIATINNTITIDLFNKYSSFENEENIFDLTNAIVNFDLKKYYEILDNVLVYNEPMQVFGLIVSTIRDMYNISYLSENSYLDIDKILKIHPYRVKLLRKSISKKSCSFYKNYLIYLGELDIKIKSGECSVETALHLIIKK